MGNSLSQCCTTEMRKSDITILMLGLDNAGKTTAVKNFLNEPVENVVPTVGFSTVDMKFRKHCIKIYDLGGGASIRGIWKNYYALVHGVVFVVDSSDTERLEQMKEVIHNVLKDQRIAGKPILLLVNKQDIDGALNEVELCTALDVESVINERQCPTRVETSCALSTLRQQGKRWKDKGIEDGFQWLLGHILDNFPRMNDRVGREIEHQKEQEERDRQERLIRVQKIRQERELEQAKKNDSGIVPADEDEELGDSGEREHNPFRPITDFQERAERKASVGGPRVIHVSPAMSPEVESLKQDTSSLPSEQDEPKHSLSEGDSSDNTVVILHHQPHQLLSNGPSNGELKVKRKKRKFANRVGPGSLDCLQSKTSELPPLKWDNAKSLSCPPSRQQPHPQHGWTQSEGENMDNRENGTALKTLEDAVQVFTTNDNT